MVTAFKCWKDDFSFLVERNKISFVISRKAVIDPLIRPSENSVATSLIDFSRGYRLSGFFSTVSQGKLRDF